jgi:hypothetical protein
MFISLIFYQVSSLSSNQNIVGLDSKIWQKVINSVVFSFSTKRDSMTYLKIPRLLIISGLYSC